MKWYEDKEYREMCEKAREIQLQKYKDGWQEGDRVWDGEKVRVIGFDFIDLKHRQLKSSYFKFAILQDLKPSFEQEMPHQPIQAKTGEYIIIEYANPVWLPSQEDLQEMVKDKEINIEYFSPSEESPSKDGRWCIMDYSTFYSHWFDRAVKLWLAFVMHELYQKKWNPEKKEWEVK